MSAVEGDIAAFLSNMRRSPKSAQITQPFIGIDECLNRGEIALLAKLLLHRGLIDSFGPLWYETRERGGAIVGTFAGGIDRDSAFRNDNPFVPNIGVPVKYRSWSDYLIAQMLIVNFINYDNLILLSENTRNNVGGIRRILNTIVAPALRDHADGLSLTALFRKGKTGIDDYCSSVGLFVEEQNYVPGYTEILF